MNEGRELLPILFLKKKKVTIANELVSYEYNLLKLLLCGFIFLGDIQQRL